MFPPKGAFLWRLDLLHVSTCESRFDFKRKKANGITVENGKRSRADNLKARELGSRQRAPIGLRCFRHIYCQPRVSGCCCRCRLSPTPVTCVLSGARRYCLLHDNSCLRVESALPKFGRGHVPNFGRTLAPSPYQLLVGVSAMFFFPARSRKCCINLPNTPRHGCSSIA